jgi:PEP-CTERM motif-containing protein
MRLRTAILSTAILLSAPLLSAQLTTYDYTGSDFNNTATGPFTSTENITGYLELSAPLAANLGTYVTGPGYTIPAADIVQWSFTVNGTPLTVSSFDTPTPFSQFVVLTDSSGNIVDSVFQVSENGNGFNVHDNNVTVDYTFTETANLNGVQGVGNALGISTLGGTWVDPPTVTATPEPSSFVLMFTALLGFGFAARKQLVPRLLPAGRIAR